MMIANRHFAVVPWRYAEQNLGVSLLSARRPCESKPSSPARVLDAAISRWNGVTGNFSTAPLAAVLIWSKVSTSKHILGTWELHCQTSKHLLRRFVHLSHHLLFKHSNTHTYNLFLPRDSEFWWRPPFFWSLPARKEMGQCQVTPKETIHAPPSNCPQCYERRAMRS